VVSNLSAGPYLAERPESAQWSRSSRCRADVALMPLTPFDGQARESARLVETGRSHKSRVGCPQSRAMSHCTTRWSRTAPARTGATTGASASASLYRDLERPISGRPGCRRSWRGAPTVSTISITKPRPGRTRWCRACRVCRLTVPLSESGVGCCGDAPYSL